MTINCYRGVGGYWDTNGNYYNLGTNGYYWTSTENGSSNAWNRIVNSSEAGVNRNTNNKANRFSVRCVKEFSRNAFVYILIVFFII